MPDWLPSTLFGLVVMLEIWIVKELISIRITCKAFEMQIGRIVSDRESEKDTIKRAHIGLHEEDKRLDQRIRVLELRRRPV